MIFVSICLIIISILFSSCAKPEVEPTPRRPTVQSPTIGDPKPQEFRVTKSTGLYDSFSLDAGQLDTLSVGTILIPADGKFGLPCDTIIEAGTEYELCKVEMVSSGKTGWILKKWIESK